MESDIRDIEIVDIDILKEDQEPIDRDIIESLKISILSKGMLHAITVIQFQGDNYKKFYVKAGRKRLLACRELKHNTVQCLVLPSNLTPDQITEVTIEENLRRYNLPWWEQVEMERIFHELRQKKHGKGKQGAKVGWSLRDTAEELGMGLGTLSQDLRLAEAVMSDPNLRKITDKVTAQRLILNTAKRIEAEVEASIPSNIEYNSILHGESSEILKHFPDNTFDVCFTDPPWLEYKDEKLTKDDKTLGVFKEIYRVLRADSFLYAIVSTPDFFIYQQELPKFGFKVQGTPLIWVKQNIVSHGLRSWEYTRDFEPILLAVKGNPVLTRSGIISSIHTSPAVHPTKLIHPNEKPVDVPMHFLEHCSYENSLILDPFGGSGVVAEACLKLRRRYVIIERDKKFYDGIERRILDYNKPKDQSS